MIAASMGAGAARRSEVRKHHNGHPWPDFSQQPLRMLHSERRLLKIVVKSKSFGHGSARIRRVFLDDPRASA
jgi:hypothetical protein